LRKKFRVEILRNAERVFSAKDFPAANYSIARSLRPRRGAAGSYCGGFSGGPIREIRG
jgi:hypothetical protein